MNAFIQKVIRAIRRRLKYVSVSYWTWVVGQKIGQWRIKNISAKRREEIINELPKRIIEPGKACLITVTFGSLFVGNRDPLLEDQLESYLAMTSDDRRVEFLVKVDFEDDLEYFYALKKKWGHKVNIRFFPSARGRGYADMHIWHSTLIKRRCESSRILLILSEDAKFIYKNWDVELIKRMDAMPHNYFIGTPCTLEEAITVMGPNPVTPVPVFWIRGDDYPIFSFPLLMTTEKVAAKYPDWTCLGNLFNVDGFPGEILRGLWKREELNCHLEIPQFFKRQGVFSWTDSPSRNKLRTATLLKFFEKETQDVRNEMASAIAAEVRKLKS